MGTSKRRSFAATGPHEQEIEGVLHKAESWYERYRKQVNMVAAVILAAVVLAGGFTVYQEGRERSSSALLSRALAEYQPRQGGQPDLGKALELLRDVAAQYPWTVSADMARYYAGNALMAMGRVQDAIAEYRVLLDRSFPSVRIDALVYQRLGYAYEIQGSAEESLKAFQKAEERTGPGMATSEQAMLLERSGKADEARKKYSLMAEKLTGTSLGDEAKRKVQTPSGAQVSDKSTDEKK